MATAIASDDICVTGMAWATPLGDTLDGVWERLLAGAGGLTETPSPYPVRSPLAGVVGKVPLDLPAAQRQLDLALPTLREAFREAGLPTDDPAVRLVLGTSYGPYLDEPDNSLEGWAESCAAELGHPHRTVVVSTACSAGSDSVLVAAELIRAGVAEICVAGGADVLTLGKRLGHTALGTMSQGQPRAFDVEHDGMVPADGAAFLVLESGRSARRRQARVHAVLRGTGSSNDATGLTAPDTTGASVVLAVRRCLADSGLDESDVAVISAHGTGTPINDQVESASLRTLFGSAPDREGPVVFGTKGALGHSLGATGAIEVISLALALRDGLVPPVKGLRNPMPDFPLPLPVGEALKFTGEVGISVTIGFGGFNTCLLLEKI